MTQQTDTAGAAPAGAWLDLVAIVICTLVWGTTWYAITLQLGQVDPIISIIYRFGLAAALLFAWCLLRGERLSLSRAEHGAALGLGICQFAINYAFVYWAEQRVASAVVAVLFAAMAFLNLGVFRIFLGQRAPIAAWIASCLGVAGVAFLSASEIAHAQSGEALTGVAFTIIAVLGACFGNLFAQRSHTTGVSVAASTAWSMAYGVAALTVFALATGRHWTFLPTWPYGLSLLHLSLNGSVVAFLLYFGLARRRGYASASYISALTPPVAMLISTLLEGKSWGPTALIGVALVLSGQVLLLRSRRS